MSLEFLRWPPQGPYCIKQIILQINNPQLFLMYLAKFLLCHSNQSWQSSLLKHRFCFPRPPTIQHIDVFKKNFVPFETMMRMVDKGFISQNLLKHLALVSLTFVIDFLYLYIFFWKMSEFRLNLNLTGVIKRLHAMVKGYIVNKHKPFLAKNICLDKIW